MTGRHDLIGSSRSVEIFAAALGSSTSGSKAYFLFKLHDPTSGESGSQQQLTTRLSSCILDMCGAKLMQALNPLHYRRREKSHLNRFEMAPGFHERSLNYKLNVTKIDETKIGIRTCF